MDLAIKHGWLDFAAGKKVGDNPYDENDDCFWFWLQGWADAALSARGIKYAN